MLGQILWIKTRIPQPIELVRIGMKRLIRPSVCIATSLRQIKVGIKVRIKAKIEVKIKKKIKMKIKMKIKIKYQNRGIPRSLLILLTGNAITKAY